MVKELARRHLGQGFEVLLILCGMLLLLNNPLAMTAELWLVFMLAVPLMVLTILFPVTLPSLFVSLELVFTFYTVLAYDMAAALWVNFVAELIASLLLAKRTRRMVVMLNPALKVVCLSLGFAAYAPVEGLMETLGWGSGMMAAKLFTVGSVFFLLNHLLLNVGLYLRTWHFRLQSCLDAVKWETIIYLVVFPLAYLGMQIESLAGAYALLILGLPVAIVTYLFRLLNRMQWSNIVNQACVRLSSTKDWSTIYQKTFDLAQKMTDSPYAMLLKRMPDGTYQGICVEGNVYDKIMHPLLDQATSTHEVMMVTDAKSAGHVLPEWQTARSLMLVPLVGQKAVFGVILLGKASAYGFNRAHVSLMRFLAHQVSMILDRNHVYEELERAAITNQLTGLYNYQYFYDQLDERFRHAEETGEDLALILFDIDHFKKYNDIYGHVVGDEVLRQVAMIAKRFTDSRGVLLARYGGEEFVAIGRLSVEEAQELAEEVRRTLESHQFVYQEHTMKHITISVGIASLRDHQAFSPNDLLEKADQALYWGGKEMGRNRVAVYSSDYDQRLFVDGMTGLHTTHYLKRKLRSLCEQLNAVPMHFLLVDVQGMRRINDQYGFEFGNQILVDASYVLKNTMRGDDVICRYLEDEFLVVVKGIPSSDLDAVIKRIRQAFAKHLFPVIGTTVRVDVMAVTLNDVQEEPYVWEWIDRSRASYYNRTAN